MSLSWNDFQGVNAAAALELYDRFRANPASVDDRARAFFERVPPPPDVAKTLAARLTPAAAATAESALAPHLVVGAVNLAHSIRRYGHLAAEIDPLGSRRMGDPALRPDTHGVTETDLRSLPASLLDGYAVAEGAGTMWDVVERLRAPGSGMDRAGDELPERLEILEHCRVRIVSVCGRVVHIGRHPNNGAKAGTTSAIPETNNRRSTILRKPASSKRP